MRSRFDALMPAAMSLLSNSHLCVRHKSGHDLCKGCMCTACTGAEVLVICMSAQKAGDWYCQGLPIFAASAIVAPATSYCVLSRVLWHDAGGRYMRPGRQSPVYSTRQDTLPFRSRFPRPATECLPGCPLSSNTLLHLAFRSYVHILLLF